MNRIVFSKSIFYIIVFLLSVPCIYGQTSNLIEQYNLGKYVDIIAETNEIIANKGDNFETWYYRGLSQQALFRYSDAIKSFTNAQKFAKNKKSVQFTIANAWEKAGNDDKALSLYKEILMTDSLHVLAKARIAAIYKSDREYFKATDYYSQLVKQDSTNGYLYSQLAYCVSKIGMTEAAADYYFTAYKLNTYDFKSVKGYLGELVKLRRYELANAYIDSFLYVFPKNLYLLKQQAFLSAIGGNYLEATKKFSAIVEMGDTSLFTCKYYGQSLYNNANYDKAVVWLNKYLNGKPDDAKNNFILALAYQKDYQYQNSLDQFDIVENIIYNKESVAQMHLERGNTFVAFGDYYSFRDSTGIKAKKQYDNALESYLNAESTFNQDYNIYKTLGTFYETKKKDTQLALYYYQIYYNKLDPLKIDEWQLIWIKDKIGKLKEEVHFIGK